MRQILKNESYKNRLKKQYPREKLNKTYKLVDTDKAPGKIYLINLKNNEIYWIASSSTFNDLNFSWDDVERISIEEFKSYKERNRILIKGSAGS